MNGQEPANPNDSHVLEHALYIGCTGSGKSHRLKLNPSLKKAKLTFVWDVEGEHDGIQCDTQAEFIRQAGKALKAKKKTKVCFRGGDLKDFDWFCRFMWLEIIDGGWLTHIVIEELADVSKGTGKEPSEYFAKLLRRGRKYGAIMLMVTQRPQEISKTAFTQTANVWCGQVAKKDLKSLSSDLGMPVNDIASLGKHEFWKVFTQEPFDPILIKKSAR